MASRLDGATAQDVCAAAQARGATDKPEAFINLGRRLARSGRFFVDETGPRKVCFTKHDANGAGMDEEHLLSIIEAEHPMEALAILSEASRQLRTIPSEAWRAAATLLQDVNARTAAVKAITEYAGDLIDNLKLPATAVADSANHGAAERERIKFRCEGRIEMLTAICRDGFKFSREAVHILATPDAGMDDISQHGRSFVDPGLLQDEVDRRVEDAPVIMVIAVPDVGIRMIRVRSSRNDQPRIASQKSG